MGARGGRLGTAPIKASGPCPKPAKLTTRARKHCHINALRPSFQRTPSNMPARPLQKRLISAIPADRAQLEQLAQLAPKNPETSRHPPEILAPDPHPASTSPSAARISACQNIALAEHPISTCRTCSRREQRQNSKRTTNPLQSIEIVRVFSCSRFSLAHIRACVRTHMRIPPKQRNSENRQYCQAMPKA
jgi:hypothetical protein